MCITGISNPSTVGLRADLRIANSDMHIGVSSFGDAMMRGGLQIDVNFNVGGADAHYHTMPWNFRPMQPTPSFLPQQNPLGSNGQTLIDDGHQLVQEGLQLILQGNVRQGMQLIQDGTALEMQGGQGTGQRGGGLVTNTQPASNNTANAQLVSGSTGQTLIDDGHQLVQEGLQLILQGNVQQGMQLIQDGTALEMQGGQGTGQGGGGLVINTQPVSSSNNDNAPTSGGQVQATNGTGAANATGNATPAHYFATTNAADLPPSIQAALARYQSDLGKVYGNGGYRGQCAQLVEALSEVGTTPTWKQGVQVRGNTSLAPGTPIATFNYNWGGRARYGSEAQPVGVSGMSHTGIYLGQDANGLYMLNQWNSNGHCSGATVSYYPWDSNAGKNGAEGGSHYYTINC